MSDIQKILQGKKVEEAKPVGVEDMAYKEWLLQSKTLVMFGILNKLRQEFLESAIARRSTEESKAFLERAWAVDEVVKRIKEKQYV